MSETQPTFIPILPSQFAGAIAVNIFALLSALALSSIVIRAAWLAIRMAWSKTSPTQAQEAVFFHTQLGKYACCLVIAMLFNAISGCIGLQWLSHRGVTEGWTCRIQAIFMQIGNVSTGYFTTAIAVHTFNSLVMKMRQSVIICRSTIASGWILAGLVAGAPFLFHLPEGYVYGAAPLACGVRAEFPKLQFFFHLLPILVASVIGAILYSLIFLVLRGSLKLKSGVKLTLDPSARWHSREGMTESYHRFIARVARSMLWYPIAYIICLIPYAVTRLFMISGFHVSFNAVVFASVCWYFLSVLDVIILYNTFRVLGPAFDAYSAVSTRKSMSMSGNLEKLAPSAMAEPDSELMKKVHQYRSESVDSKDSREKLLSNTSIPYSRQYLLPLHTAPMDRASVFPENSGLERSIVASNNYYQEVILPPPVARSPRRLNRQLSSNSQSELGLPAPPRQSRSALLNLPESSKSSKEATGDENSEQWLSHQRSTQTFGHQYSPTVPTSPSLYSDDGMSEWPSRQQSLRRQPSPGHPALSAIAYKFPQVTTDRLSPPVSAMLGRSTSAYSATPNPPLSPEIGANGLRSLLLAARAPRRSSVDTNYSRFNSSTPRYL